MTCAMGVAYPQNQATSSRRTRNSSKTCPVPPRSPADVPAGSLAGMREAGLDLPIHKVLPDLHRALAGGGAVLTAPPGTGKTTLVPLALAGLVPDLPDEPRRVLVAEPRR